MAEPTPMVTQGQKKAELSTANFIAVAVLVTFIVVVIAGVLLKGRFTAYQQGLHVSKAKDTAITNLQSDLTSYNNLKSTYEDLSAKGEDKLIMDALPSTPDITALATALDAQASQAGVNLTSVSTATATTGAATTPGAAVAPAVAGATPMNVTVAATGSYAQVMSYLQTIEKSVRPMKVSSITFSGTSSAISASITLLTYYAAPANLQMSTEAVK